MVVQVRRADFEGDESWERVTDEEDLLGVSAGWHLTDRAGGGWLVFVNVMEFVREELLEGELRRRIAAALRSVGGVTAAVESDREKSSCGAGMRVPRRRPGTQAERPSGGVPAGGAR